MKMMIYIIIGCLTVSLFVGVFSLALYDTANKYNVTLDSNFTNTLDRINGTYAETQAMTNTLTSSAQESEGVTTGFTSDVVLPKGVLSALKTGYQSVGIAGTMSTEILNVLPIPQIVKDHLYSALLIILIMIIVALIINRWF